ncbi:MAG: arginine repressor [Ruminococcus sp.]|nr:arginine repressor [Ruminococcus sp.]
MRSQRHQMIMKLVSEKCIDTQESLQAELAKKGFSVTQATVSRDIKELSLIKTIAPDGSYRYSIPSLKKSGMQEGGSAVLSFISESVSSVDYAGNTVVVKCHSGMAQAVCAKLDDTGLDNVVGTLAGDDTIFILMRTESDAQRLLKELNTILYSK